MGEEIIRGLTAWYITQIANSHLLRSILKKQKNRTLELALREERVAKANLSNGIRNTIRFIHNEILWGGGE